MSYGLRIYNKYGFYSIDEESRMLRIYDKGLITIPAVYQDGSSIWWFGSNDVAITPTPYKPLVTILQVDSSSTDVMVAAQVQDDNSDGLYDLIYFQNWSSSTCDIYWRAYTYL